MEQQPERQLYVETVLDGVGSCVFMSNTRKATPEDILRFNSLPCAHDTCKEQLVYDTPGFIWDFRYCAVCNTFLGGV